MSVFLAVDLDAPTRVAAAALIETHRANFPAKWLRTDKLHCTLVFLGNPPPEQVALWVPVIDALAGRHGPFRLRLQGAGTFTTARAPSVLWLGVVGELGPLCALQADAAGVLGVAQEKVFVPHVTLARARTSLSELSSSLGAFETGEFFVDHLSLYSSSSEVYRVVHQAPLTPALSPLRREREKV